MAERGDGEQTRRIGVLRAIWRRKEIVAICTLLVPAVVLFFSLREEPVYEATATVLVQPEQGEAPSPGEVIALADADEVVEGTGEELGGADPEFISDHVTVSSGDGPNLFRVEGTADQGHPRSPDQAARLATTYAEQFVDYTQELGEGFAGEAELVEEADPPDDPSSPKTVRNTLLGALAGFLIGIVVALLRDRLDPRVSSARELDGLLGVPLLGRVPESVALSREEGMQELPAAEAETFQMARVGIRYLDVDREIKTVLVTSPAAGDGKTTFAFGLGVAGATSGDRVLVIEADMRQPSPVALAEPSRVGLSTLLEGNADIDDAVTTVDVTTGAEGVSGAMDVLCAGAAPPNPTQLIESRRMTELLYEVDREYDLVVIDTPPATILPDAIPLMGHVDGVVVVAGLGRDRRDALLELRERLEQVDAPLIGAVANFAAAPDESYFEHILAHEAAVAEAGTVPLRPAARAPRRRPRPEPQPAIERPAAVQLPDGPVDLNAVTYEELRALDLSTTQAKRLLAYRERAGGFSSIDDIDEVPGFPDAVREGLKQRLTV
jgi:receptor protein-tyrosine kinase